MKILNKIEMAAYRMLEQIDGEKHHFILLSYKKAQLFKWRILTKLK